MNSHTRQRSTSARLVVGISASLLVTALSGCSSSGAVTVSTDSDSTTSTAAPTSTVAPSSATVTDLDSCAAFADVSTILFNAAVGLNEGRMTQQEYDGWMRLATRVLDRVPVSGEGDVSNAIMALKAVAPPVPAGTNGPTAINTDAWNSAAPLSEACEAAGSTYAIDGFTGG